MATQITMPMLGEGMHEGTIGKWLKQPGEQVEKYEPLVEIITDKVNTEIPSPADGVLTNILVEEGLTVEVGAVLAEMQEAGAEVSASTNGKGSHAALEQTAQQAPVPEEEPTGSFPAGRAVSGWYEEKSILDDLGEDEPAEAVPAKDGKPHRYTPVVRRMAEEHHLDLSKLDIKGSGLGGRITRDDLLNYLEQQRQKGLEAMPAQPAAQPATEPQIAVPAGQGKFQPVMTAAMRGMETQEPKTAPAEVRRVEPAPSAPAATTATAAAFTPPPASAPVPTPPAAPASMPVAASSTTDFNRQPSTVNRQSDGGPAFTEEMFGQTGDEVVALTPMRKAIAEHMARSKQTTPHAWTIVEVDMTRLVQFREKEKEDFKRREGIGLTYLPFIIQAVIKGLRQFPQLNASWSPERGGIVVKRELNLGVAIDVPDGLIVPVIYRADEKSLVGLARNLNDLITRARDKKLSLADVQGGTFTVNNPGAFGSVLSYPVINQPQAGIITMEAIVKRPVVVTDAAGNDSISIRSMMNMCLSFDHRVVDGAYAGRFLQFVKQRLENETPRLD